MIKLTNWYHRQETCKKIIISILLTGLIVTLLLPLSDRMKLMLSAVSFLAALFIILIKTKLHFPLTLLILILYVLSAIYELATGDQQYNNFTRLSWALGNILIPFAVWSMTTFENK